MRLVKSAQLKEAKTLRAFPVFAQLDDHQIQLLSESIEIYVAEPGETIIKIGDKEPYTMLLLRGELRLRAADGRSKTIASGSESALHPIAQLLPRKFDVIAKVHTAVIKMDDLLFRNLFQSMQSNQTAKHTFDMIEQVDESEQVNRLLEKIRSDLDKDKLMLPSLPDIGIRIGNTFSKKAMNVSQVARIVLTDPAITAKLIHVANSAFYAGRDRVNSCEDAIVRIGINVTRQLILSFVLTDLFKTNDKRLQKRMCELWKHTLSVASIAYVLAKINKGFSQDHALLAGLTHKIGLIAIYGYASKYTHLIEHEAELDQACALLQNEIGAQILQKWNFDEPLITVAAEAEQWFRDPAPEADYCDIVNVAILHNLAQAPQKGSLPYIDDLPCFHKLQLGELTEQHSLQIVEEYREQLRQINGILDS